jgi:formyltetrahydrofolate-dependent phosphoribosylglycinamide formyltransferase
MKKIAIFASGGGSNFKAIQRHIESGDICANIELLISNNSNSGAVEYALEKNIETLIINEVRFPDFKKGEIFLLKKLVFKEIDLICLAGYIKLLSQSIVGKFNNCILNIHPALLPQFGGKGFYGMKVHEAVIKSGAKVSGATVHFVNENYDEGQIIAQEKIMINNDYTPEILSKKVLQIEHELYPRVIKDFCENKLK